MFFFQNLLRISSYVVLTICYWLYLTYQVYMYDLYKWHVTDVMLIDDTYWAVAMLANKS